MVEVELRNMENEIENSKIVFLFGAGAELAFGLPSGEKYIEETILNKREDMYSALGGFYKNRKDDYAESYAGQYLFRRDSHTFREMIENAARKVEDNERDDKTEEYMDLLNAYEKLKKGTEETKQCKEKLKQLEQDIYDAIVINKDQQNYKTLKEHLSYYGVVEKDFATILAPKEAGPHRFW